MWIRKLAIANVVSSITFTACLSAGELPDDVDSLQAGLQIADPTFCPAEFGSCEDNGAWGGGGVSSGPSGGLGGGGVGPSRIPGTGCDRNSTEYRDVQNWITARAAVTYAGDCFNAGYEWEPTGHVTNDGRNEQRLDTIRCKRGSEIIGELSAPTTAQCFGEALELAWP